MTRALAFLLAAALVLPPAEAAAQAVAVIRSAPVGGAVPVGIPVRPGLRAPSSAPSLALPSLSPTLTAPVVVPARDSVRTESHGRARASAIASAAPVAAGILAAPAAQSVAAVKTDETPEASPEQDRSPESAAAEAGRRFDLSRPAEGSAEPVPVGGAPAAQPSGLAPAAAPDAPAAQPPAPAGKVKLPRTVWGTIIGHGLLTVFGIELHVISQPFLVMETLGQSKTTMGLVRNVHSGSFSLTNLLPVGYLVDKTDFRALFIGTSLARALLMGAIPALWMAGHLSIAALLVIVALNPLFQTTMVVAERSAIMAAVGTDEKLNKEATAIMGKWESLAGLFMPLLAGWALGALVQAFGLGGYAMAYGIYAAMLVAAVPLYWLMVRDPRDPKELGWAGLAGFVRESGRFMGALLLGVLKLPYHALRALWRLLRNGRAAPPAAPAPAGLKERLASVLDRHESTKGLAYILRNRTLSLLMLVGAVEAFLMEALPLVVLPNYIVDVIGEAPAGVPFIGALLATSGGILGLMFSAEYLGRFISSWYMEGERGDRLTARLGGAGLYRVAAVSSLLFWALWLVPSFLAPGFWAGLGTVVAVMGLIQLFHAPVSVILAPLKRREIADDMLGRVESAFDMVDLALASAGALLAGLVMDLASLQVAMALIAAFVTATAAFQWLVARRLYPKKP